MRREDIICLVLGGGRGTRLDPLTRYRSKPAVPVGGKFRLVDVPISNSLNSSIRRIMVLTQFNSVSLNTHLTRTYRFDVFSGGFVRVLAAEQTAENTSWFQGTADAVRRSLLHVEPFAPRDLLILSGDQLYRMDFGRMLRLHRESGAAATIAVKAVPKEATPAFGLVRVGGGGRVESFLEKPQDEALLAGYELGDKGYAASMGIYVFRRDVLQEALHSTDHTDFGHQVLPALVDDHDVRAYVFDGYWEDIGTIRAYYEAGLELAGPKPSFVFHKQGAPIYTEPRFLGASRVQSCRIRNSMICDGCYLRGGSIEQSVIGIRTVVRRDAVIRGTILMGADVYEGDVPRPAGAPRLGIGRGCHIEGAIIDKNARVGDGVRVRQKPSGTHEDHAFYHVRDGIVIIPKNAIVPAGCEI